jgi:Rrf2 family transcriptional regulator, iron-sulfur cluster assembly transcription factor
MFSKACQYAIKSMVYIQNSSAKGERVNLNQISEAIDSPVAFTSKILQQLKKKGLLVSIAGVSGGFNIPVGKEITLKQIVIAIDSSEMFISCVLGLSKCNAVNPCPLHHLFATERNKMNEYLANTNLKELSDNFELKKISLK